MNKAVVAVMALTLSFLSMAFSATEGNCSCGVQANGACISPCPSPSNPGATQWTYTDYYGKITNLNVTTGNIAPPSFFTERPFIAELKARYNPVTDGFNDAYLDTAWNHVRMNRNSVPKSIPENATPFATWLNIAQQNAEIYLDDIIFSQITGQGRIYPNPQSYELYYYNYNQGSLDQWIRNIGIFASPDGDGDQLIELGAQYVMTLNIIGLLDENSYYTNLVPRRQMNDLLFNYLVNTKVGDFNFTDFKDHNNLCMRVMAAIAIEDFSIPVKTCRYHAFDSLTKWITLKVSPDGRYAEGSDYLKYLNDILLPCVFVGYKCGWIDPTDNVLDIVRRSGCWLADIADPSGYFPEVNDACGGRRYRIAPYIGLCGLPVFTYLAKTNVPYSIYDIGFYGTDFITYTPNNLWPFRWDMGNPLWTMFHHVRNHGGIGKINILSNSPPYLSLTLLTHEGNSYPSQPSTQPSLSQLITQGAKVGNGTVIASTATTGLVFTGAALLDAFVPGLGTTVAGASTIVVGATGIAAGPATVALGGAASGIAAASFSPVGSHDQQDHGSIVVRCGNEQLILDPQYAGYSEKLAETISDDQSSEALYCNHNTVQYFGPSNGGINPCPVTNVGSYSFLAGPGGGESEITQTYNSGLNAHIQLDVGGSYDRAVISRNLSGLGEDKAFFVFDRVTPAGVSRSRRNPRDLSGVTNLAKYDLHYNLPAPYVGGVPASPTDAIKAPNVVEATSVVAYDVYKWIANTAGQSMIRVSAFCNQTLEDVSVTAESFHHRDDDTLTAKPVRMNAAHFITTVGLNPGRIGFISILEPKYASESFGAYFTQISLGGLNVLGTKKVLAYPKISLENPANPSNVICCTNQETDLYAFENLDVTGTYIGLSYFTVPRGFATDAEFGLVQFDPNNQSIIQALLYNVKKVSYGGAALNLPGTLLAELDIRWVGTDELELTFNGNGGIIQTDPRFENGNSPSRIRKTGFAIQGRNHSRRF